MTATVDIDVKRDGSCIDPSLFFCKLMRDNVLNKVNKVTVATMDVPDSIIKHSAWLRLEDQLQWYDRKSVDCQCWYKWLKFAQMALAVFIPVMSLLPSDIAKWTAAISGAAIALLEAFQHINQFSMLWITYRATAERLKHEKYLFLSAAGPYRELSEPERLTLLAERVEEQVSTEHANWFDETQRIAKSGKSEGK